MTGWLQESYRALWGSWLILRGRAGEAFTLFNLTEAGFWRSFSAFFLAAPIYLVAVRLGMPEARTEAQEVAIGGEMVISLLSLALQWVAWPLVMVFVARALKLSHAYARYIIIYNWSSVLVLALQMPPMLIYAFGLADVQATGLLMLGILVIVLFYRWRIAREGLGATALVAVALVLLDLVLSVGINRLFL